MSSLLNQHTELLFLGKQLLFYLTTEVSPPVTALYLVYIFILELKQACSPSVSFASCRTSFTMILFLSVTRTSKFLHCDHLCKTKGDVESNCNFYTLFIFSPKSWKGNTKNTNTTDPARTFESPAFGVFSQGRKSRFWNAAQSNLLSNLLCFYESREWPWDRGWDSPG